VVVPLTCLVVTCAWLLDRLTGAQISRLLRRVWPRPWAQALIVMLLTSWFFTGKQIGFQPYHLPWIIGILIALIPIAIVVNAVEHKLNRMTRGRLNSWAHALRKGASRPWLMVTVMIGVTYNVLWWGAMFFEPDPADNGLFTTLAMVAATTFAGTEVGVPVFIVVFFVFFVPFRILRHTRYFRLVTTSIVAVLAVIVLSLYAVTCVKNAAQSLHHDGKFTPGLSTLLGIQPQIATIEWRDDDAKQKLIPQDRKVLILGQSEEAVWLYDCVEKRTIRVSGGVIVATKLVLDDNESLTCIP
jgi:hypothetical protein